MPPLSFCFWFALVWGAGWLFFPVARYLFADVLPDGGLAVGRVLFLATWTLAAFWAGTLGVSTQISAFFWLLLAGIGLLWAALDGKALHAQIGTRRRAIIASETVFLLVFLGFFLLRGYWSDTNGNNGEKAMDSALIGSIARAERLPPPNPYSAGARLQSYYYFGHLETALLTNASFTTTRWSYNLMCATLPALCFSVVFSLGAALTGQLRGGLFTSIAVLGLGTLQPLHQFYQWLHPDSLAPPHPFHLDFFATSRVIPFSINEFPWFTFNQADLHAHYFDFPFALATIALSYAIFRGRKGAIGAAIFVLSAQILTNLWDFPAYGLLVGLAIVARPGHAKLDFFAELRRFLARFSLAIVVIAGALVVASPYLLHIKTAAQFPAWLPQPASPLREWLLLWGICAAAWLAFLCISIESEARWRAEKPKAFPAAPTRSDSAPLLPQPTPTQREWLWLLRTGAAISFALLWAALSAKRRKRPREVPAARRLSLRLWGLGALVGIAFLAVIEFLSTFSDSKSPHIPEKPGELVPVAPLLLPQPRSPDRTRFWLWELGATFGEVFSEAIDALARHGRVLGLGLGVLVLGIACNGNFSDWGQPSRVVLPLMGVFLLLSLWGAFKFSGQSRFLCFLAVAGLVALLWSETTWAGFLGDAKTPGFADYKRQDTVFKFGLQTWMLWGLAAAGGAWLSLERWPEWLRLTFVPALSVMVIASMSVVWGRTRNFSHWDGWDGWAHLAPSQQAAATWLLQHTPRGQNLLEAESREGGDYSPYTPFAHATGIPTVIGPQAHSFQWSPANSGKANLEWMEVFRRKSDARTIYQSDNALARRTLLNFYRVRYIVVGDLERAEYGPEALQHLRRQFPLRAQFGAPGEIDSVQIYENTASR